MKRGIMIIFCVIELSGCASPKTDYGVTVESNRRYIQALQSMAADPSDKELQEMAKEQLRRERAYQSGSDRELEEKVMRSARDNIREREMEEERRRYEKEKYQRESMERVREQQRQIEENIREDNHRREMHKLRNDFRMLQAY